MRVVSFFQFVVENNALASGHGDCIHLLNQVARTKQYESLGKKGHSKCGSQHCEMKVYT